MTQTLAEALPVALSNYQKTGPTFLYLAIAHRDHLGGSVQIGNNHLESLRSQYLKTAQKLLEKGDYQKAAFVYIRLLKDYHEAAKVLKQGQLYQEAAQVYLDMIQAPLMAAECYEKGKLYQQAADIYQEQNKFEKAGDMQVHLGNQNKAKTLYGKAIEIHLQQNEHLKASELALHKLNDRIRSQIILFDGWKSQHEGYLCLSRYLDNLNSQEVFLSELKRIREGYVDLDNRETFINVLQSKFKKQPALSAEIKEMGYEEIAKQVPMNANIVEKIKEFTPEDKETLKDILRFKTDNSGY